MMLVREDNCGVEPCAEQLGGEVFRKSFEATHLPAEQLFSHCFRCELCALHLAKSCDLRLLRGTQGARGLSAAKESATDAFRTSYDVF